MSSDNTIKDIEFIKDVMSKSTKFNSISGLSGILAGSYLLIGAFLYNLWLKNVLFRDVTFLGLDYQVLSAIFVLFIVFVLSLISLVILTSKKSKRKSEKVWNTSSKRLLVNFMIPFLSGVAFIFLTLSRIEYSLSSALMLLFYGLTLVNGSKYTLGDLRSLGLLEIAIGLLTVLLPQYSYEFFITGFGVLNIVYGIVLYYKYDR